MADGAKFRILINTHSYQCRKFGACRLEREAVALFHSHGIAAESTTVRSAHLEPAVVRALADCDVLVLAGGDGTVRTAARHMLHTSKVLGIIPCGTMNLLARDLGIPLDLPKAVSALARSKRMVIDAAEVNGQLFLCSALIGVFPEISPVRERLRSRSFLLAPAIGWATLRAIRRFPTLQAEIRTNTCSERIRTKAAVSNARGCK